MIHHLIIACQILHLECYNMQYRKPISIHQLPKKHIIYIYIMIYRWFPPLWKIFVSWGYYSQYMEKKKMFQTTNQIWIISILWWYWFFNPQKKLLKNIVNKHPLSMAWFPLWFAQKSHPPNITIIKPFLKFLNASNSVETRKCSS